MIGRSVALAVVLAVLLASACGAGTGTTADNELVVFAAASLTEPLTEAADAYADGRPGLTVRLSFDSSAALRTQIENGAPADVFLAADATNPARLVDAGLSDGPALPFARNALAIIAPATGTRVTTAADLGRDGIAIIAAGEEVPITSYADEIVRRLAALPGYPGDLAARYARNVVSREDNVKAVVAKIELGEADAAIVYRTDALAADGVRTIALPAEVDVVATYAGVVVGSPGSAEARRFFEWLGGPRGREILGAAGFLPP